MQTSNLFSERRHEASFASLFSSYPTVLSSISVGAILLDNQCQILAANTFVTHALQIEDTRLIKAPLTDILSIYREKQDILCQVFNRLSEKKPVIDLPVPCYIQIDKSKKKFYIKGQFIAQYFSGKLLQVIFIFQNIEGEFHPESLLNRALRQTKIFTWFFDMEKSHIIIDAGWFAYLGISTKSCVLTLRDFLKRVHPDERGDFMKALSQLLTGESLLDTFTYRLRREDGNWEWFEGRSISLDQEEGIPYRMMGICQSIQEHKNKEEHLIAARDKAAESDRLKSAFLANMSHEIRTPLNAIVGFANLLANEEEIREVEEKKEYGRLISLSSEQLLRLISDILDLSKIESNTMVYNIRSHNLNSILVDLYRTQKINMPPNVEMRLEMPPTDIRIHTDELRLKQILNNLINNAIKFTSKGNIIIGYRILNEKKQIEIFVKDTGKGISKNQLAHIFERFYKAESFSSGFGLGLSICKTIIETLGGSIAVSSNLYQGSCFTITHPF